MMRLYLVSVFTILTSLAYAQSGSSPNILLPSGSSKSLEEGGNESSRYRVRELPPRQKSERLPIGQTPRPEYLREQGLEFEQVEQKKAPSQPKAISKKERQTGFPLTPPKSQQFYEKKEVANKKFKIIELQIAPTLLYTDSKSKYWYRSFTSASPALYVGTSIWINHFVGFHSSYLTSLGSDVGASASNTSRIKVKQQWFDFGITFRKANSQNGAIFKYGLLFSEYQFKPSLENTAKMRLKTTGPLIFVRTEILQSATKTFFTELEFLPWAKHKETATGIDAPTGAKNESHRISVSIGQIFKATNADNIFWEIKGSLEKNQFEGDATVADPKTAETPNSSSVSNQTFLFKVGYEFAN